MTGDTTGCVGSITFHNNTLYFIQIKKDRASACRRYKMNSKLGFYSKVLLCMISSFLIVLIDRTAPVMYFFSYREYHFPN